MKRFFFLPALGFILGIAGLSATASAAPATGLLDAVDTQNLAGGLPVIKVHGCHRRTRWGPGRGWWHRHVGRFCDPVRTRPPRSVRDPYFAPRPPHRPRWQARNYRRYLRFLARYDVSPRDYPYRPYIDYRYYKPRYRWGYGRPRPRNCVKDWHCVKRGPFGLRKKCFWRQICS